MPINDNFYHSVSFISEKPSDPVIKFNDNTSQDGYIKLTCESSLLNLTCISEYGNPPPRLYWNIEGKSLNGINEQLRHEENNYTTILNWNLAEYYAQQFHSSNLQCCLDHITLHQPICTKTLQLNRDKYKG